jgi:hypothetical protein
VDQAGLSLTARAVVRERVILAEDLEGAQVALARDKALLVVALGVLVELAHDG